MSTQVAGSVPVGTPVDHASAAAMAWLRSNRAGAQFTRFVAVGGASNIVYLALFVTLAPGSAMIANLVGTITSTALATELHRQITFRACDRVDWFTAQWEGGGLAVVGLILSSAALATLHATTTHPSVLLSGAVVISATAAAGLFRFLTLRGLF
ncbi:GtrA family protein [Williamsia sp. CHRR-6]|uniref:GtrA family protein n=1 Tax=Williamsia sp. CHRR-6 TaxID=2835871 RepID=UPI001BDA1B0E|nr:GtrA family protein [Williamsia sp. CHRR-6]MBT0566165.1 GtrA family protein [Williamsia sp. CHRR-6]